MDPITRFNRYFRDLLVVHVRVLICRAKVGLVRNMPEYPGALSPSVAVCRFFKGDAWVSTFRDILGFNRPISGTVPFRLRGLASNDDVRRDMDQGRVSNDVSTGLAIRKFPTAGFFRYRVATFAADGSSNVYPRAVRRTACISENRPYKVPRRVIAGAAQWWASIFRVGAFCPGEDRYLFFRFPLILSKMRELDQQCDQCYRWYSYGWEFLVRGRFWCPCLLLSAGELHLLLGTGVQVWCFVSG